MIQAETRMADRPSGTDHDRARKRRRREITAETRRQKQSLLPRTRERTRIAVMGRIEANGRPGSVTFASEQNRARVTASGVAMPSPIQSGVASIFFFPAGNVPDGWYYPQPLLSKDANLTLDARFSASQVRA